jgi:quercetin dioxygenase-like cupin family protein
MRSSRIAGLLLVSIATLAQQSQPVEITSEPRHHLVFENQYVRVFDVTVEPKGSTLVHRHSHDYLFVTLGDSDVVSVRPGEKPAHLVLKDGETRFTPGNFSHAAINESEKPFHNITIELLKPSTAVKTCTDSCNVACAKAPSPCSRKTEQLISSDQWVVTSTSSEDGKLPPEAANLPRLVIAVANVSKLSGDTVAIGTSGQLGWVAVGSSVAFLTTGGAGPARYVTLSFKPEKP